MATTNPIVQLPSGGLYQISPSDFGEAAEVLLARAYDAVLAPRGRFGYDLAFPDRTLRQVKARSKSDHGVSRKIEIKSWDFQILMVLYFDTDRVTLLRAGEIHKRDLQRLRAYDSRTNNCPEYSLTRKFWASPKMTDITDDLLQRMSDRELSMPGIYGEFHDEMVEKFRAEQRQA